MTGGAAPGEPGEPGEPGRPASPPPGPLRPWNLPWRAAFHLAHRVHRVAQLCGWRLRRARWIGGIRLRARWHRGRVECRVAGDLRLGRRVRTTVAPRTRSVVSVGEGCRIGDGVRIELRGGSLELGGRVDIRHGCVLGVAGRLAMEGPNVLQHGCTLHCDESITLRHQAAIGEYVTVVDSSHSHEGEAEWFIHELRTAPVLLGRQVWVGAKATIGRGVSVGDLSVVGANSVVVKDAGPGVLVSGVPAREVRRISPEDRAQVVRAPLPAVAGNGRASSS